MSNRYSHCTYKASQ